MPRGSDLNSPSIEYFLVKDDDGGISRERRVSRPYDCEIARTGLPHTVNLPMALTMPFLKSYTCSFKEKGTSILGWKR